MEYWNEGFSQRRQARLVLAAVAAWSLAAHGYCYFNLFYSHDSLLVYQNDVYWQISLGRFLHPVYFRLRGNFYAPALVGALSILFLAGAVFLMVRLLELKSRTLTVLLCGVLASSATVTLTNATYLHDADIYMLALLLAAAGVYACARLPWGVPLGGAVLCLSLGLYQAYFQTAVFLCMLLVAKKILEGSSVREILTAGVPSLGAPPPGGGLAHHPPKAPRAPP